MERGLHLLVVCLLTVLRPGLGSTPGVLGEWCGPVEQEGFLERSIRSASSQALGVPSRPPFLQGNIFVLGSRKTGTFTFTV